MIQCVQVIVGCAGLGASGSVTIKASVFVPLGTPPISKGGEIFLPSQVYLVGIGWPAEKAGDLTVRVPAPMAGITKVAKTHAIMKVSVPRSIRTVDLRICPCKPLNRQKLNPVFGHFTNKKDPGLGRSLG